MFSNGWVENIQSLKSLLMKQVSTLLAVAAVFAACTSNPKTGAEVKPLTSQGVTILADTTGLSEFQAWKNQKAVESNSIATGTKTVVAYADDNTSVAKAAPVRKAAVKRSSSTRSRTANRTYRSGSSTVYSPAPSTTASTPVQQKRGWSKAAKGAAIGAGGGAIAGAVLSKNNRALGAVIGGIVGGGVGYGIGRSQDKKDGRY